MSLFRKCVKCDTLRPMSELNAQGVCIAHRTPLGTKAWDEKETKIIERAQREKEKESILKCESCDTPISLKEHKMKGLCKRCTYKAFK